MAARPKTLPAAVAPVIVGSALAVADGLFNPLPALAALLGSMLLQIAVNLANDYFDYVRGVDTPDRVGPVRVAASGLIAPQRLRFGLLVTNLIGVATGPWVAGLIGDRVSLTAGLLTGLAVGAAAIVPLLVAVRLETRAEASLDRSGIYPTP